MSTYTLDICKKMKVKMCLKTKQKTVLGLNILEFNVPGISCYCFLRQGLSLAFRLLAFQTWYVARLTLRIHPLELAQCWAGHTHQHVRLSAEVFSIGQMGLLLSDTTYVPGPRQWLYYNNNILYNNGFIPGGKGSVDHTHSPGWSVHKIADPITICSGRNNCWNRGLC